MNEVYEYQQNKMIFHYNFALGQLAIELLNHLFEKDKEILMGIEHGYAFPDVKNICNPDNIIMAPRIQDLSCLYMLDFITDAQLTDIIIQYHLDFNDLAILRIEQGTRFVPDYEVVALAEVFNVSCEYLLGLTDAPAK